jgi:hypothetical protein
MKAHHNWPVREQVTALVEEGRLSASAAGGWYGVSRSMAEHGYRNTVRMDKLEGAEELGYGMYPVQLRMLCY